MSTLHFHKMHGCGNDFILIDSTKESSVRFSGRDIAFLCNRNFGIGADGLVELVTDSDGKYRWHFYNCDGTEAEMCGNAARCAILYLTDRYEPHAEIISIETLAGTLKGRKLEDKLVEVAMFNEAKLERVDINQRTFNMDDLDIRLYEVNTGVPHAVIEVDSLKDYPTKEVGKFLVKHKAFGSSGTNITYFERALGNEIRSVTFERGVERLTMACGTGVVAASLVYCHIYVRTLPLDVRVPGGQLTVNKSEFSDRILLTGPAEYVCEGDWTGASSGLEKRFEYGGKGLRG